jgi:hypothetical protein
MKINDVLTEIPQENCRKDDKHVFVICTKAISDGDAVVELGEKGSQCVNKASKGRQDTSDQRRTKNTSEL